jgi:hypothetical protein
MTEKAWAFYRRSTDKQELSIDDQRRECLAFAARIGSQKSPQQYISEIMASVSEFDQTWEQDAAPEERRSYLRQFIQSIEVDIHPGHARAHVMLWPIPQTQKTCSEIAVQGISKQVSCGG